MRSSAAVAVLSLSSQCSDTAAVESLLEKIFGVLSGSEGKVRNLKIQRYKKCGKKCFKKCPFLPHQVTVNTHKASLLSAAGSLVKSGVTGAGVTSLANTATRLFVKVLETEAHEGTLVMALEMLAAWANKFSNEIPAR